MDAIEIHGGAPLHGAIPVSGAKNAALKLMAAALLTDEPVILSNMPRLADTRFMAHLLAHLGVEAQEENSAVMRLHARTITNTTAPYDLVRKMRATFNVLGPLLAREGVAQVSLPGGCAIGARPVDLHLTALEALGAEIVLEGGYVHGRAPENGAGRRLRGARIAFPFVSVGATEHAMLAAVLAQGETTLENAAREPEILDLANCLNAMGARIAGAGTGAIRIQGVTRLHGVAHAVVPDRIETGTYALAAGAAGRRGMQTGARAARNAARWAHLRAAGAAIDVTNEGVRVTRNGAGLMACDMATAPYPGFPTDLQAQFMAAMTLADGVSVIRETIFENRFMHAPELGRMGAEIAVRGNEATVRGVDHLTGAPVMATDLRASVSLILAGLAARGRTVVNRVYHLDRGFERLEEKLSACGARVARTRV